MNVVVSPWWVAELHYTVLLLPLLKERGGENMMKKDLVKDREIVDLLLLQTQQTQ